MPGWRWDRTANRMRREEDISRGPSGKPSKPVSTEAEDWDRLFATLTTAQQERARELREHLRDPETDSLGCPYWIIFTARGGGDAPLCKGGQGCLHPQRTPRHPCRPVYTYAGGAAASSASLTLGLPAPPGATMLPPPPVPVEPAPAADPVMSDADVAEALDAAPAVAAPTAAEAAWEEATRDLRRAQFGLLRLQCPDLPDEHLDPVAQATMESALTPLLPLDHGARMARVAALIEETRQRCSVVRQRADASRRDTAATSARSRSASTDASRSEQGPEGA